MSLRGRILSKEQERPSARRQTAEALLRSCCATATAAAVLDSTCRQHLFLRLNGAFHYLLLDSWPSRILMSFYITYYFHIRAGVGRFLGFRGSDMGTLLSGYGFFGIKPENIFLGSGFG